MADDLCDAGGHAEHAWPGDPVRQQHREEGVGYELSVHGAIRVRRRVAVPGDLGLHDVIRREAAPVLGQGGADALGQGFLIDQARLPHTLHFYHNDTIEMPEITPAYPMASMVYFQCVFAAITLIQLADSPVGPHEIQSLDDLRPALAHLLLHHWRVLHLGRRLPLPLGTPWTTPEATPSTSPRVS
jgi:hypothetical protein